MRSALVCLLAMTGVALAQPPGEAKPAAPEDEVEPLTYTFGVDGHFAMGSLVEQHAAARFELGLTRGHAIVVRAGIGETNWLDSEIDDPSYRERFVHAGYRISSRRLFAGIELGRAWFKADYSDTPAEYAPKNPPHWFAETAVNLGAGVRFWRVRLSLDYELRFHQIGLLAGVDIVSL
ncbi:MAG: hypothetical protein HOV81_12685 [Kofleriaceae bacterium]|nr:hypothetical protein [Kofleriaceae bacterium]